MSFFAINTTDHSQRITPPVRGEIALLILIVVCGFALRAAYPSKMSIEHFDEGIYASNVWFGEGEDFRYPNRHLYAPPLLPFLLEWSVILFGPSAAGTMLIGIVCGGGTIGLIWWVARRWFGVEAGIAAATLAAFSDYHLLYSRTALTDVLLLLFVLLAVYFTWEAFRKMRLRWIVAAGMTTGLASHQIGIVCGGGTVGLIWWVARRWFGVEAGIAAATLAAFSDYHLLYSRTALTDVLLLLFVLLAVYFTWEAFRKMRLRWIVAAGMTTGLAWWTKYNGWLPLAIGLSGAIPWVSFSHLERC